MYPWILRLGLVSLVLALCSNESQAQRMSDRGFSGRNVFFGGFPVFGLGGFPGYGYGGYPGYGYGGYPNYGGGGYPLYSTANMSSGFYEGVITYPGWIVSGGSAALPRGAEFPAVAVPADSSLLEVETSRVSPKAAYIVIYVPTGAAQVWFDSVATGERGLARHHYTPELQPGHEYSYDVQVQWTDESGQVRSARRSVTFQAGSQIAVTFNP